MHSLTHLLLALSLATLAGCACSADTSSDRNDGETDPPSAERPSAPTEPPPTPKDTPKADHNTRSGKLTTTPAAPSAKGNNVAPPPAAIKTPCGTTNPGHHPPTQPAGGSKATPTTVAAKCPPEAACDAQRFITEGHARCVAKTQGLKHGTKPWEFDLFFDSTLKRPVWSVRNTEGTGKVTLGDGSKAGSIYGTTTLVDAMTAKALSSEPWSIAY